jgi:hypothetical protein
MRVTEVFNFIRERWLIQQRRAAGQPKPWTKNKIFQQYRFTCVYREDDKVTRWITENWRRPHKDDPDLWFAMTLARFFNLPATLDVVQYPVPWRPVQVLKRLEKYERDITFNTAAYYVPTCNPGRRTVFSSAYMVRSDPGRKINYVTDVVLAPLWKARETVRPRKGDKLAQFFNRLVSYYGMGSFMAAQVIADTKQVGVLKKADDWWTWSASGPGSRRGLNRVLGRPKDAPWREEEWLDQLQLLQIGLAPLLREAGMPRMCAQDTQGIGCCEFDKYERARLGEGRPKQKYPGT